MMPYFVSNDIRHRKIARRIEPVLHLLVEGQIDVEFLVGGTIKRSGSGTCISASGLNYISEQHNSRFGIITTLFLKYACPNIFSFGKYNLHKLGSLVIGGLLFRRHWLTLLLLLHHIRNLGWIAAHQQVDDDGDYTDYTATYR